MDAKAQLPVNMSPKRSRGESLKQAISVSLKNEAAENAGSSQGDNTEEDLVVVVEDDQQSDQSDNRNLSPLSPNHKTFAKK